jgi:hypothetical protein
MAGKAATFGMSQASGLSPKTILEVINKPGAFAKEEMAKVNREALGETVFKGITKRLDDLSETGKEYNIIRSSNQTVNVPMNNLKDTLSTKYGITFDANGKVIRTAETTPLKPGDISALEDFIDIYGDTNEMSANAFLNARKALSNLAEYDAAKSDVANVIAKDLRRQLDSFGKEQLEGLSKLDAKYGPERELLSKVRRDYLNPDGTFKDNALTKIANLTKEGRQSVLGRIKKIVPDIEEQLNILNAIEDIKGTMGNKVGTYSRSVLGPLGGFSVAGIPGAIVSMMLTNPYTAVAVLRQYGNIKQGLKPIIDGLIGKMKKGVKLDEKELNIIKEAVKETATKVKTK